jgi:hypothetical protein
MPLVVIPSGARDLLFAEELVEERSEACHSEERSDEESAFSFHLCRAVSHGKSTLRYSGEWPSRQWKHPGGSQRLWAELPTQDK